MKIKHLKVRRKQITIRILVLLSNQHVGWKSFNHCNVLHYYSLTSNILVTVSFLFLLLPFRSGCQWWMGREHEHGTCHISSFSFSYPLTFSNTFFQIMITRVYFCTILLVDMCKILGRTLESFNDYFLVLTYPPYAKAVCTIILFAIKVLWSWPSVEHLATYATMYIKD